MGRADSISGAHSCRNSVFVVTHIEFLGRGDHGIYPLANHVDVIWIKAQLLSKIHKIFLRQVFTIIGTNFHLTLLLEKYCFLKENDCI